MIDLVASEQNILTRIGVVADNPATSFKLYAYPGMPEDLGKPRRCFEGYLRFNKVTYPEIPGNKYNRNCRSHIAKIEWSIKLVNGDTRDHTGLYNRGLAVIDAIRGCQLLVFQPGSLDSGQSTLEVTSYSFNKVVDRFCYEFDINFFSTYTENYDLERP